MPESGSSVGAIHLELTVLDTVNRQIGEIAGKAQSAARRDFCGVGDAIGDSISRGVADAAKSIDKPLKTARQTAQKTADEIGKAMERVATATEKSATDGGPLFPPESGGKKSTLAYREAPSGAPSAISKPADTIPAFEVAADDAGRLEQKLGNINSQIGLQLDKLAGLQRQYDELSDYGRKVTPDTQAVDAKITAIQGRLISLQDAADKTEAKLAKALGAQGSADQLAGQIDKAKRKLDVSPVVDRARKTIARGSQAAQAQVRRAADGCAQAVASSAKTAHRQTEGVFAGVKTSAGKLGKSIKSALKSAFLIAGLYATFRALKESIASAAAADKEFSASLSGVKANLSVAFAGITSAVMPALTAMMRGLEAASKQIAAFISGLMGKSYAQSLAAAKQLQQAKKEADGLKGSLSSIDKLDVIGSQDEDQDSSGLSGLDAGGTAAAEGAAKKIKDMLASAAAEAADIFSGVGDGIQRGLKKIDFGAIKKNLSGAFSGAAGYAKKFLADLKPALKSGSSALGEIIGQGLSVGGKGLEILSGAANKFLDDNRSKFSRWSEDVSGNLQRGFDGIRKTASVIGGTLYDSLDRNKGKIETTLSGLATSVSDVWGTVTYIASDAFGRISDKIGSWSEENSGKISGFWDSVIGTFTGYGDTLNKIVQDTTGLLQKNWDDHFGGVIDGITGFCLDVRGWFMDLYATYVKPIIDKMLSWVQKIWDENLKGLVDEVMGFVGRIGELLVGLYNNVIKPVVDWIMVNIVPVIREAICKIIDVVGSVKNAIVGVFKSVFQIFNGIIDFFKNVFSGDWEAAWNGIADVFSGVWDTIQSTCKGVLNAIINLINGLIDGINHIPDGLSSLINTVSSKLNKVLEFVGLEIPEVSIPKIPHIPALARGGLVSAPTLAMVGDNPHASTDPEVVSPLSRLQGMMGSAEIVDAIFEMASMIITAIRDKDSNIYLDGKALARGIYRYLADEAARRGTSLVEVR